MHLFNMPCMAEVLTPGESGVAEISHFEISEDTARFANLRARIHNDYDAEVDPGTYAKLRVHGQLMMTDTSMERRTNSRFLRYAKGRVFVGGLGLGMILHGLLKVGGVTEVVVVEKYADVIKLVAPTLPKELKVTIIEADLLDWKPPKGEMFDTIYFDIWPTIDPDNLKEIAKLKRRFRSRLNPGGWMGAWVEDKLRYLSRY